MRRRRALKLVGIISFFLLAGVSAAWAEEPSYLLDQSVDESMGVLNRPWQTNLVRLQSRLDHPYSTGGLPPYDQEVERAQEIRQQQRICTDTQGTPIPC